MRNKYPIIKGCPNYLFDKGQLMESIHRTLKNVAERFSYKSTFLSIIQDKDLFKKSLGDSTDVVNKELFYLKNE